MSVSNGTITAPINIKDPYTCLGVGASGGLYDVGYICSNKHGKINMWSRYKPIRGGTYGISLSENGNWKGTDGQCGIDFSGAILTSYTEVIGKVTSESYNGWGYAAPAGGSGSPFRLTDFIGYFHTATPPVHGFIVPEKVASGGTLTANILYSRFREPPEDGTYTPGSIALNEFSYRGVPLTDYHLGIVVTDASNNYKGRSFGSGLTPCTYSVAGLAVGSTYKAWPLIARTATGQTSPDEASNTYICLPLCGPQEFKVVSAQEASGLGISLICKCIGSFSEKTGISYTLAITSKTTRTLKGNSIYMRFSTSDVTGSLLQGEQHTALPDITVDSGSPYTKEGTFSIGSAYASRSYYVYATFAANAYKTGKIVPLTSSPDGVEVRFRPIRAGGQDKTCITKKWN